MPANDPFTAEFRDALTRCPAIRPILLRLADRLLRTGSLSGRMKLGERLPGDLLATLGRLFANTALDARPTGEVYLRLDRTGLPPEAVRRWIDALCEALEIPSACPRTEAERMQADAGTVIDRCRLLYPDLTSVWESMQVTEVVSAVRARGLDTAQDELLRLAEAARFLLSDHAPIGPADIGARCFGDSKALKSSPALARRIEEWLLHVRDEEITEDSRRQVWADCGVVANTTAVKVTLFGPVVYEKRCERFDWISRLHAMGEPATLSWDNVNGIDSIELPPNTPVTTCENETPFGGLVRERRPGLVIYTAGYPNSAVRRVLELLPDDAIVQHWGDSDPDGLHIAERIDRIRPVHLWRCGLPDLVANRASMIPLSPERRRRAESFLSANPEFPFARELAYTLANGWLEQERWAEPAPVRPR